MFRYKNLKNIHLEITNRCQASCPMCSRNYHGGLSNPLLKKGEWTLDSFKQVMHIDLLNHLEGFYFCGNFGDPIINDDLLKMIEYSHSVNPNLYIRLHTNGSARSVEWWKELANSMSENHNVIFALDGLSDTHEIYRIGTNYSKILDNAKSFIDAGGKAEWCFIKFKHNEHQVDEARAVANSLGFHRFTVKNSSRFVGKNQFDVYDKDGKTVYSLYPPGDNKITPITTDIIENYKELVNASEINCYVQESKEIYIDAFHNVFPCCFLASIPFNYSPANDLLHDIRNEIHAQYNHLIETFGGIENLSALNRSVCEIIESDAWQSAWHYYWTQNKLITCARTCGKNNISKPKDQFIEVEQL
jgi:MoaA/NifB/PqqE/SkfB family radical SAM enzyme